MDRCYVLYIKAKNTMFTDEVFDIYDRIEWLTADEVKLVLATLKADLKKGGHNITHYCSELGSFSAYRYTYTVEVTAIPYNRQA